MLDRIDVQIELMPVTAADLFVATSGGEPSADVAERVAKARAAASARWSADGWRVNAEVPGPRLRQPPWRLPLRDTQPLRRRLDSGSLSARGFDRVLRLSWSIADLDGRDRPTIDDVEEALALRTGGGRRFDG